MEKKPPIYLYGVFDHFSRTNEVAKFSMIKLYLNVSDVVYVNEQVTLANCGLQVDF